MNIDKLVRMANDITRNLGAFPDAPAAVAEHLKSFWTRKMVQQLITHSDGGGEGLAPIAQAAARTLKTGQAA